MALYVYIYIYIINFKIKKICRANQLTGFYMMATLAFNELIKYDQTKFKKLYVLNSFA